MDWHVWVYVGAACLTIPVRLSVRGRRDLAPVASRLSAGQQVA